jgi:integrase
MLPEAKLTFKDLADWYLDLVSVKRLASYARVKGVLSNFNQQFGNTLAANIKPIDLECYQDNREEQGLAPATIDMELSIVKTMVTKAFDNDLVSGYGLKPFRNVRRKLKKGSNARKATIPIEDYIRLVDVAHNHLRPVIITAMNTGMRKGELRQLQWDHIDMKKGFIRLPADLTKEGTAKIIPINHHVKAALNALPCALKHGFVFTFQGEPIKHKDSLNKSFQTAAPRPRSLMAGKRKAGSPFTISVER